MKKEYIYTAVAILFWGASATISKYFFEGLDTIYVMAIGFLFASITLLICQAKKTKNDLKQASKKDLISMLAIGSLGILICNYFYLFAISLLEAQVAFVINYLWPSLVMIFSVWILKEKMTVGKMMAILMAFIGVCLAATNGHFSAFLNGNIKGVFMAIMSAVTYGLYTPLNKKATYNKDLALTLSFLFASVVCIVVSIMQKTFIIPSLFQLVGFVLFGIIANAFAYLAWIKAMEIGNVAVLSNLIYLTPVVSLFCTHFVLGEAITIFSVIGLALILLGLLIQVKLQ